jgi:hypothetical protein
MVETVWGFTHGANYGLGRAFVWGRAFDDGQGKEGRMRVMTNSAVVTVTGSVPSFKK